MKRRAHFFWLILLLYLVFLSACDNTNEPTADTTAEGNGSAMFVEDLTTLIQALEAEGADVQGVGPGDDAFFISPEQLINVNGEQVQVYEFRSVEEVEDAAASVNATGTVVGTNNVDWAATPHFYRSGNLIAIYAGEQEDVLSLLSATLGEPFVTGVPMVPPGADNTNDNGNNNDNSNENSNGNDNNS